MNPCSWILKLHSKFYLVNFVSKTKSRMFKILRLCLCRGHDRRLLCCKPSYELFFLFPLGASFECLNKSKRLVVRRRPSGAPLTASRSMHHKLSPSPYEAWESCCFSVAVICLFIHCGWDKWTDADRRETYPFVSSSLISSGNEVVQA